MDDARWERLFGDLGAQYERAERDELDAEVADRTRREVARIRLSDRMRAAVGGAVACRVIGAGVVPGVLAAVGPDWLLLAETPGREALVPMSSLVAVAGLGRLSAVPGGEGRVAARLGLGHALRGIARDRTAVAVTLTDSSVVSGTVDRVGADFVDVAEHPMGEARRATGVQAVRTVPFTGLALLRRS